MSVAGRFAYGLVNLGSSVSFSPLRIVRNQCRYRTSMSNRPVWRRWLVRRRDWPHGRG